MDENRAVSGVEVVEKFGPITEDETELLLRCSPYGELCRGICVPRVVAVDLVVSSFIFSSFRERENRAFERELKGSYSVLNQCRQISSFHQIFSLSYLF